MNTYWSNPLVWTANVKLVMNPNVSHNDKSSYAATINVLESTNENLHFDRTSIKISFLTNIPLGPFQKLLVSLCWK